MLNLQHDQEQTPLLPQHEQEPQQLRNASISSSVVNITLSAAGACILALPYTFHLAGGIYSGLACLIVSTLLALESLNMLQSCTDDSVTSYREIGTMIYGPWMGKLVDFVMALLLIGALAIFQVLYADLLGQVFNKIFGTELDRSIIMLLCTIIIFPVCLFRRLHALRAFSLLGIFCLLFVIVTVIMKRCTSDKSWDVTESTNTWFNQLKGCLRAIGVQTLAYLCHFNFNPMYNELYNPTRCRIIAVTHTSILILFLFYASFAIFGYLLFSSSVASDILTNFEPNDPLICAARYVLGLCIILKTPLTVQPLRQIITPLLESCLCHFRPNYSIAFDLVATVLVLGSVWVLAVTFRTLNVALDVVSGTSGVLVAIILPALFQFRKTACCDNFTRIKCVVICVVGVLVSIRSLTAIGH